MNTGITTLVLCALLIALSAFPGAAPAMGTEELETICAQCLGRALRDAAEVLIEYEEEATIVSFSAELLGREEPKNEPASRDTVSCAHSLFEQPWWLDAVAPGAWDAAVVVRDGEIVGRLPYVRKRRFGLTILSQPLLTQFLGPWIKASAGKEHTRLAHEHQIATGLIDVLPPHDVFMQNVHRSMTNCLAFQWRGFSQAVRYTYVLEDLTDLDKIWADFRENIRREIRKAERSVAIRPIDDVDILIPLIRMTFQRQGLKMPYSADVVRRLDDACRARGVRRIWVAEGTDGAPHAGLFLVWDADSAYYLMGGLDPSGRASGAMSLLLWEAIKHAAQVTRRFDFEGSMLQPVERFFRAFGARQVLYAELSRGGTLKGQLALLAHEFYAARKRRPA
jgi:Acetyltransferase (GNAT) domain